MLLWLLDKPRGGWGLGRTGSVHVTFPTGEHPCVLDTLQVERFTPGRPLQRPVCLQRVQAGAVFPFLKTIFRDTARWAQQSCCISAEALPTMCRVTGAEPVTWNSCTVPSSLCTPASSSLHILAVPAAHTPAQI